MLKKWNGIRIMSNLVASVLLPLLLSSCQPISPGLPTKESPAIKEVDETLVWLKEQINTDDFATALSASSLNADTLRKDAIVEALKSCDEQDVHKLYTQTHTHYVLKQSHHDYTEEAQEVLHTLHEVHNLPLPLQDTKPLEEEDGVAESLLCAPFQLDIGEEDISTLLENLKAQQFSITQEQPEVQLVKLLHSDACETYWPRFCEEKREWEQSQESCIENQAKLDVSLSCQLLKGAKALRLDYSQNTHKVDLWRTYLDDDSIRGMRSRVFLRDMLKNGPRVAFNRIDIPHAQYHKLLASRQIYLDAMDRGGWHKVQAPSKLPNHQIGKSYPYIQDIRIRLKEEGYAIDDVESEIYDEGLEQAIILYRELHQLSPKNILDSVLIRNMAYPPEARLASMDITIQRYRESVIGEVDYYIVVNIPDFHAELWRNGERLLRFAVVVGNNHIQRDMETKQPVRDPETNEIIYPNRTPIMNAKLNEIIYNPYWNVPARIRIEELEPKLAENPNYYVENFFEEVNVGDPRLYYVRELPNPRNSLGKVKFMFPNPHNVYLHDTPAKSLFKVPIRAYSHGCIRVQDPLLFAETLLRQDHSWDSAYVQGLLNQDPPEQTSIFLNRLVDVYLDYFDTRVDDQGPVAFLSDIYGYDSLLKEKAKKKGR